MKLFDTHAHLLDERFDEDREKLIASLPDKGVAHIMECACMEKDLVRVPELVKRYPGYISGAVGVHPHYAAEFPAAKVTLVEAALGNEGILAVGEVGLDYHYDFAPRDVQRELFAAQAELAAEKRLPLLIHDREAHGDTMDVLKALKGRGFGIMHCFSGSYEMAKELIDLGYHIGIGGSATFKNNRRMKEMLPKLPPERIVLETDCPYMTPEPFRGERNDPSLTAVTCHHIADLIGMDADALAEQCHENACRLFGLAE
ncbi:MAG: TatD family hydrolase [Clostridia bacterium]|nr:TatD family hydrolase [Clostridia bacterium]